MRKQLTVRLDLDLHERAMAKAQRELRSLNAIVSRLLEKWLAGEVDLEPPKEEEALEEE